MKEFIYDYIVPAGCTIICICFLGAIIFAATAPVQYKIVELQTNPPKYVIDKYAGWFPQSRYTYQWDTQAEAEAQVAKLTGWTTCSEKVVKTIKHQ